MRRALILTLALAMLAAGAKNVRPDHVDLTWFSISNMFLEIGSVGVVVDGYISRVPQSEFFGGGGGLASTHNPQVPDRAGVSKVLSALGGKSKVQYLLTGHSHFDHSFDTATWSGLTGAPIIGAKSTCLQAVAQKIPAKRCREVKGGETIRLSEWATMRVIRWNHSGDHSTNPEQHDAVELKAAPVPDPKTGGLRAGVAEDFPNGGGNRAFLFTVDGAKGQLSWLFTNSAGAGDLEKPIVVDGVDYGAPLENLKKAMADAKLSSVDLWIGAGGGPVAKLVLPVLHPKAYLPVHWDGLYGAFFAGVPRAFGDAGLDRELAAGGVKLIRPAQYMDKWRLSADGVTAENNSAIKRSLGFTP